MDIWPHGINKKCIHNFALTGQTGRENGKRDATTQFIVQR